MPLRRICRRVASSASAGSARRAGTTLRMAMVSRLRICRRVASTRACSLARVARRSTSISRRGRSPRPARTGGPGRSPALAADGRRRSSSSGCRRCRRRGGPARPARRAAPSAIDRELRVHVLELLRGVLHRRLRLGAGTHGEHAPGYGSPSSAASARANPSDEPWRPTRRDRRDPGRLGRRVPALADRLRRRADELRRERPVHDPAALDLATPARVAVDARAPSRSRSVARSCRTGRARRRRPTSGGA